MAAIADPRIAPGAAALSFHRLLAAPRRIVWAAWTEAERFRRWFGPHGSTMDPCELDARAGGRVYFCHHLDGHDPVWVLGRFLDVEAPRRLVFEFGFSDADGAPRPREDFAERSFVEVVLEEATLADGRPGTSMHVRHTGLTRDQGEGEGWRQGLERLDALLGQAPENWNKDLPQ